MKAFLDTSVLVATFYAGHGRHKPSFEVFLCNTRPGAFTNPGA